MKYDRHCASLDDGQWGPFQNISCPSKRQSIPCLSVPNDFFESVRVPSLKKKERLKFEMMALCISPDSNQSVVVEKKTKKSWTGLKRLHWIEKIGSEKIASD